MKAEEFYKKTVNDIDFDRTESEQDIHSPAFLVDFAEAYHKEKMNGFTLLNPNEVAVDEKYFKEIEKFFNNYA